MEGSVLIPKKYALIANGPVILAETARGPLMKDAIIVVSMGIFLKNATSLEWETCVSIVTQEVI